MSNRGESSPFRETNYEPQLFVGWATDYRFAGWTLRDVEIGVNHQSNGRSDPTSRSWNRGYARLMAQNGNWQVDLKPRFRFSESSSNDDNPDITKYMGYYRLKVGYAQGDSVFSVDSHYNWNSGYGGAELGWSYPITRNVRFYTRVQRLRRIADRLQLPADTGGRWCHAERYYVIIPGGCVPMKNGEVCVNRSSD